MRTRNKIRESNQIMLSRCFPLRKGLGSELERKGRSPGQKQQAALNASEDKMELTGQTMNLTAVRCGEERIDTLQHFVVNECVRSCNEE